jgi:HK97 family phage portal protein
MSARTQNSGRGKNIAVLGSDLDYTPIGSTAAESQLLETRGFNIDEVARYFNISPQLLGDLAHTQYGSLEQAQLDFLMHCLMPYISMIEDEFNRKLLKPSESTLFIDLDENHIMKADKQATANYLSTLTSAGIMSINEARHLLDLAPVDGGDDLIIPYTNIEDNTIGKTKTNDKNTEEQ